MKTRLLISIFLLIHFSLSSQNPVRRINVKNRAAFSRKGIYIGIVGSPDYAYRLLYGPSDGFDFKLRNDQEIPKLSFTAGLSALWQIKEKIGIEIGLSYSLKGEKTRELSADKDGGDLCMSKFYQTRYYNTSYLEIPLRFNYHLLKKKFSSYLFGGISCNIFLANKSIYYNTSIDGVKSTEKVNDKIETIPAGLVISYGFKNNDFNRIDPQIQFGFGIDYTWASFRFKLEPIFKYSLFDVNTKEYSSDEHFYSLGLNVGAYYRIWKHR